MKTLNRPTLLLLAFMAFSTSIFSQNVVFVLIDVSGNPLRQPQSTWITSSDRRDAINLVRALLLGNYSMADFPNWSPNHLSPRLQLIYQGSGSSLLQPNSRLFLIPYGEKDRYLDFEEFSIVSPSTDVKGFIDMAYNLRYKDQLTFEKLAIAKAVRISRDNDYANFLIIQIGGLGGDKTASQQYSPHEQSMLDDFDSGVDIISHGSFRIANPAKELTVSIKEYDINTLINWYVKTNNEQDTIIPEFIQRPELRIISPSGSRSNPFKQDVGKPILISWRCRHCEPTPKFLIRITGIDGTLFGKSYTVDNAYTRSLNLETGNYRISLSSGNISASPVYVSVKGSSGGIWLFLFLIGGLIALLIIIVKKQFFKTGKTKDKFDDNTDFDDQYANTKQKDTRTGNNSDEDYF